VAERCVIGVDLGGTKLLAGVVDQDLGIRARLRREIAGLSRADVIDEIVAAVEQVRGEIADEPMAVGIGFPATFDRANGRIVRSPHLPFEDVALADLLAERIDLPIATDNDATCAAIAEHRAGSAISAWNAVVMTIGTGIGAGIIVGGQLQRGAHGSAGELGHIQIDPAGGPCAPGCPGTGCFETHVSGSALLREAEAVSIKRPESALGRAYAQGRLTSPAVVELAHDGDLAAVEAIGTVGHWLGVGLVTVVNLLDPELIVVGGGLAAAGDLLLEPAREVIAERAMPPAAKDVRLAVARFGADAGLLGAAMLGRDRIVGRT